LLVDPGAGVVVIGVDTIGEPELDLVLGGLDGIGAVADVAADVEAQVTTDGTGSGIGGVGGADDLAAGLDDLLTLPDHAHDGAGAHVVDEVAEEGLGGEIGVVLLGVGLLGLHHLHAAEEETLLLEALDDGADEAALDAVGLDHDVGALGGHDCGLEFFDFVNRGCLFF